MNKTPIVAVLIIFVGIILRLYDLNETVWLLGTFITLTGAAALLLNFASKRLHSPASALLMFVGILFFLYGQYVLNEFILLGGFFITLTGAAALLLNFSLISSKVAALMMFVGIVLVVLLPYEFTFIFGLFISTIGSVLLLLTLETSTVSRREGFQGVVKNLRMEGGTANFWLQVHGKGDFVPVEAYVGEMPIREEDNVLVRGKIGSDGILRAREVQGQAAGMLGTQYRPMVRERMDRRGKTEFTGIVLGGPYDLNVKKPGLMSRSLSQPGQFDVRKEVGFRVQRVDEGGNPIDVVEVEVKEGDFKGMVYDRDSVFVQGEWTKDGRVRASWIRNITTRSVVARRSWRNVIIAAAIVVFILIVYFIVSNVFF